mmetsp:Transcript_12429/g.31517  ORF Transcript_12429/g.31517 Transcript_12429/m.31517 type:complete len:563 (-) Transcript_12429:418-2106(-)
MDEGTDDDLQTDQKLSRTSLQAAELSRAHETDLVGEQMLHQNLSTLYSSGSPSLAAYLSSRPSREVTAAQCISLLADLDRTRHISGSSSESVLTEEDVASVLGLALYNLPNQGDDPFDTLPNELLYLVFNFLDIEDLCRCEAVCKRWRIFLRDASQLWKDVMRRTWPVPASLWIQEHPRAKSSFSFPRCYYSLMQAPAFQPSLMGTISSLSKGRNWRSVCRRRAGSESNWRRNSLVRKELTFPMGRYGNSPSDKYEITGACMASKLPALQSNWPDPFDKPATRICLATRERCILSWDGSCERYAPEKPMFRLMQRMNEEVFGLRMIGQSLFCAGRRRVYVLNASTGTLQTNVTSHHAHRFRCMHVSTSDLVLGEEIVGCIHRAVLRPEELVFEHVIQRPNQSLIHALQISGDMIYYVDDHGLFSVDVRTPAAPTQLVPVSLAEGAVAYMGRVAVADEYHRCFFSVDDKLMSQDLRMPGVSADVATGSYMDGWISSIEVLGDRLLTGSNAGTVNLWNVKSLQRPLTQHSTLSWVNSIQVDEEKLFVACKARNLLFEYGVASIV